MNLTLGLRPDEYIDISPLKETGDELKQAITNAVKDTQSAILLAPLPHVLIMSWAQHLDLNPDPDMAEAYKAKDRIYIARDADGDILCVMDVVVKDPPPAQGEE